MKIARAYASVPALEYMLDKHGVDWHEVQEALVNATSVRRTRTARHGQKRYMAFGPTEAGRRPAIVFAVEGRDTARVITAFDEKRRRRR